MLFSSHIGANLHLNLIPFDGTWQFCKGDSNICICRESLPPSCRRSSATLSVHNEVVTMETEGMCGEQKGLKLKWFDVGPNLTNTQKHAISQLSPTLSNRCKALMRRAICFSPQEENLPFLLASWVKAMKPKRCHWLLILKEMKKLDFPFYFEVMEYALMENSFEPNVRDYTKLIDAYAKTDRVHDALKIFQTMKDRGVQCDQVTLTVLIYMYSKAGDLYRAKEAFEEIRLPDKRAYGSMVMAYIRAQELFLAESLLKQMEAKEAFVGREVYKAMLRSYSNSGDADGAQRIFDAIQFAGIVPDSKLCALLVNAYCLAGKTEGARSCIDNMRNAGLKPNDKCIALMLGAYNKDGKLESALDFLMKLEKDGVEIEEEASEVLARWLRQIGVIEEVGLVLREFLEVKRRGIASSP
ncbi:hypothetical protein HPP92_001656 [Vanilla planifolia]|uniref:PROP1-like PPR domain-containing protein n=1 Tax=Vanilla planifolia TaxID=51239 RepID=A0A835RYF3_VANPL|nr:hypothetical protein HPP92_001656 [Vanilla planifolia]